jgi:hypothetical protein
MAILAEFGVAHSKRQSKAGSSLLILFPGHKSH